MKTKKYTARKDMAHTGIKGRFLVKRRVSHRFGVFAEERPAYGHNGRKRKVLYTL